MKKQKLLYVLPIILFTTIIVAADFHGADDPMIPTDSKIPTEINESVNDVEKESSDESFNTMMNVLTHKRCMNCHPSDDIPKQGEDSHPHYFGMARGDQNKGFEAINCQTCHQEENNDFSGVPGAPEWSLAPASMRWEGLSRVEIAESILDPKRNGGRTNHETMEHLTEHPLVLWAWEPGVNAAGNPREKPPVPKDEYIEAVKNWFEQGAVIPQ